jgi:hypothetical protein
VAVVLVAPVMFVEAALGDVAEFTLPVGLLFENANDDATLEISDFPGFNVLLAKLNPLKPVI